MNAAVTTSNSNNPGLVQQLTQELLSRYALHVSQSWLSDFISTVRHPIPPLPALASTANFRLLNSDFTNSLSSISTQHPSNLLPRDISDVNVKHIQLQTNVPVQVLDIVDVGSSKYSQIEGIERVERGEEVRGREVIRNVPIMNEDDGVGGSSSGTGGTGPSTGQVQGTGKKSTGPHKLLLQDAAGTRVWGFELVSVPKICITMTAEDGGLQIGAKIMLKKGLFVRRGLVMLEPDGVTVLGGKVDEWNKSWRARRKQRLLDELKRESDEQVDE